jgi:hypothetical protein
MSNVPQHRLLQVARRYLKKASDVEPLAGMDLPGDVEQRDVQLAYLKSVVKLLRCSLHEGPAAEEGFGRLTENPPEGGAVILTAGSGGVAETSAEAGRGEAANGAGFGGLTSGGVGGFGGLEARTRPGGDHADPILGGAVKEGLVSPKVQALVKTLLEYRADTEDFRCIVFVERIATAKVGGFRESG